MNRMTKNALSVLLATIVATIAVYGAVSAFGGGAAATRLYASAGLAEQACPATGCTGSSCHGAQGQRPPGRARQSGSGQGGRNAEPEDELEWD
jgi:hypothetical protein